MIYSLGFNYNKVGGSMPDFIEKFSREFRTPMPKQSDGGGIQVGVVVQKDMSEWLYLKSGFGLVHKKVNPEEQAYPLYKDSLNSWYISIPLLIGVQTSLDAKKTIDAFFETGILGNFAIGDKSYKAPDRVAFSHSGAVATYQVSAGFSFIVAPNASLVLQYAYSLDISPAYRETLYLGATNQTYFYGDYKYHTSSLSLGLKLGIHG